MTPMWRIGPPRSRRPCSSISAHLTIASSKKASAAPMTASTSPASGSRNFAAGATAQSPVFRPVAIHRTRSIRTWDAIRATTGRNTYQLQGNVTKVAGVAHHQSRHRCAADQLSATEHRKHSVLPGRHHVDATLQHQRRFHAGRSVCDIPARHRERIFELSGLSMVATGVYGALRERRLEGVAEADAQPRPALRPHAVRARETQSA